MVMAGAAIAGGLLVLAFAPDRFVAGAAGLADRWGLSRVVIGAVVIGFGTSLPELLVSGLAAAGGDPQVGIGNIVGSNMANLGLIVAVAGLVGRVAVPTGLLRREVPLMVAATVVFAVVVQDGLRPWEGGLLLAGLVAALTLIVRSAGTAAGPGGPDGPGGPGGPDAAARPDGEPAVAGQPGGDAELAEEVAEILPAGADRATGPLVIATLAGLLGTLAGAQLLVGGAVDIADELGLSGGFVGMTVVALGTSLPELVTAVAAARTGEDQLILGNVLGSNLFNCLAVGAVVAFAGAEPATRTGVPGSAVALMLVLTALGTSAMVRRRLVTRGESVALLATYVAFLPLLAT